MNNEHQIVSQAKASKDKLLNNLASEYEKNKPLGKSVRKLINKMKDRIFLLTNK